MSETPIVVTATVRAKPGCADELEEKLRLDAAIRAAEPGNLAFLVARSARDDHEFHLYEVYADSAAHVEHRRLTRLPDDPHRGRIAELVEGVSVVRGALVYGSATFESDEDEPARGTNGHDAVPQSAVLTPPATSSGPRYPLEGLRV